MKERTRLESLSLCSQQQERHSPHTPQRGGASGFSTPCYTGLYGVGHLEAELAVDELRTSSRIKRENRPALQLGTVLFSVYSPIDLVQTKGQRSVSWLPRPRLPTCQGCHKFFSIRDSRQQPALHVHVVHEAACVPQPEACLGPAGGCYHG